MKKQLILSIFILLCTSPAQSKTYILNGSQSSEIEYQMRQSIQPAYGIKKIILSYVVPGSYNSPTYNQNIINADYNFSPRPSNRHDSTDKRGNKIIEVTWLPPLRPIIATINLTVKNELHLGKIKTDAPYPLKTIPSDVQIYLKPTKQVASDNISIIKKAEELAKTAKTEFDAVQMILSWIIDHMHYVSVPESYDALYSLKTGRGNCQNYSHLAAAFMRSVQIPVRIVNGITLKKPYDFRTDRAIMTMKMAQGRHSWIEIWFPDLGWVPFDPASTEMFISNRYIRIEIGKDNNETENDGLVKWTYAKGTNGKPEFEESISGTFVSDTVKITGKKMDYGPKGLMLCPPVTADFSIIKPVPEPDKPDIPITLGIDYEKLIYKVPFIYGNLEFPENRDFLTTRGPAEEDEDGTVKMGKNFLVETAEYVTTRGQQYSQTFILKKPVKLTSVGLALHKFGGDGQIWLELFKDNNGNPGEYISTSDLYLLDSIKYNPGYSWVHFSFENGKIILPPGRYWIALGFTGSPVLNWFFTYGKPIGPQDGTKYKTLFDETWSRSLSYEFNYKIEGSTVK